MYIREYMHTGVVTIGREKLLTEAQKVMEKHNIRRLPVVEKNKLVGLLTQDRMRVVTKLPGLPINTFDFLGLLSKLRVKDVMVTNVITVNCDPRCNRRRGYQHGSGAPCGNVPVLQSEQLVGIITTTDLHRLLTQMLGFGQPGVQLHIFGCNVRPIEELRQLIASKRARILSLFHVTPPGTGRDDCIIRVDTDNTDEIVHELLMKGYGVEVRSSTSCHSEKEAIVH